MASPPKTRARKPRSPQARRPIQHVRLALWLLIAAILIAVAAFVWRAEMGGRQFASSIGGPFSLVDQKGVTVTEADLKGHPSLMFFGYTFCPDVCPTTLFEAGQWLKALGPDGDRLKVYFVTVDPERDTEQQLSNYLQAFDPRITGLTGPHAALDPMLKAYRVYWKKVGEGEDYAMDHTAAVYLLDGNADLVGTVDYQEDEAKVLAKLKRLVAG